MLLEERLNEWAQNNPGRQADLAVKIANAIKSPAEMALWSLVDIRAEFEARAPEQAESRWWIDPLIGAFFLVPVGFAWFHLFDVFSKFREASLRLPEGVSMDFLTFWNRGYPDAARQTQSMPISQVALWVVVIIALIAFFNFALSKWDRASGVDTSELDSLILDTSLALGNSRAIRPEEIADVLKESGQYLILGLDNLRDALSGTEKIVAQVASVAVSLNESAQRIDDATRGLQSSMAPLADFSVTAKSAEQGLRGAGDTIRSAADSLASSVVSNVSGLNQIKDELVRVADSVAGSRSGLDNVVSSASEVSVQVRKLSDRFAQIVDLTNQSGARFPELVTELDKAINRVNELAKKVDDPLVEPYVAAILETVTKMTNTGMQMTDAVKHMSEQLNKWSAEINANLS